MLPQFLPLPIAWHAVGWTLGYQSITTVVLDNQGDPWFIDDQQRLHHITAEQSQTWELPPLTFQERLLPGLVGGNDGQTPPLVFLGTRLLQWRGGQWQSWPMPLDAKVYRHFCPSIVTQGPQVWGIDSATEGGRIIQFDLSTEPLQATEIFPPAEAQANQFVFHCLVATNTDDFVAVLANATDVAFYRLKQNSWQKVTTFSKTRTSNLYLNDLTVDAAGQIWVVLVDWVPGAKVGRYAPQTDTWVWFDIKHAADSAADLFLYDQIAVDARGRVWLTAEQHQLGGPTLFNTPPATAEPVYTKSHSTVGVYDVTPDNVLVEKWLYTAKNSGLETSRVADLRLEPDGRLWTWNQHLVWMDSTAPTLPTPLPNWVASLLNLPTILVIQFFSLLLIVVVSVLEIRAKRKAQRP